MTALSKYADIVVRDFVENITEHLFRAIEDTDEYKKQVKEHSRQAVNALIGKRVKTVLKLGNVRRSKSGVLAIQSHMTHKPPV